MERPSNVIQHDQDGNEENTRYAKQFDEELTTTDYRSREWYSDLYPEHQLLYSCVRGAIDDNEEFDMPQSFKAGLMRNVIALRDKLA